jgi:hypothetical protein
MTLDALLARLDGVKPTGQGYMARCPAHPDDTQSLGVRVSDDAKILTHCFAGCSTAAVLEALGLTMKDLFPETDPPKQKTVVATYRYHDRDGRHLYDVLRYHPKDFKQRRADGVWSMNGVRRVLYRLPDIQGAMTVYIPEGEKDVEALRALGLTATTNPGGADPKRWQPAYTAQLTTAAVERVVILPDNDDRGRAHAETVARSCHDAGLHVQVLALSGLPAKGDVSDWLAAGHTKAELAALVAATPRYYTPAADAPAATAGGGLPPAHLADAVTVAAEGRQIAEQGIRYLVPGLIPAYGMLGFLIAFAKVGKTTFGQALAAAVAMGAEFLGHIVTQVRVLIIAAEDPPEYTAWLARHLMLPEGRLTFYRGAVLLDPPGLTAIAQTVREGGYGLVLIASWQAVVRGLMRDENDNAAGVRIVEDVKTTTRATGIPWLIDAHSGKGEDQSDDADPTHALRGASSAAGAADYMLSLRYANGAFGRHRRLSGKGRFVNLPAQTLDFDPETSTYTLVGATKDAKNESMYAHICEADALNGTPRTIAQIAEAIGLLKPGVKVSATLRKRIAAALNGRPDVLRNEEPRRGGKTTVYCRGPVQ